MGSWTNHGKIAGNQANIISGPPKSISHAKITPTK